MDDDVKFVWCIGVYEGERAKSVLDHASLGIGYFIRRSEGGGRGAWVEAAFRWPTNHLQPEHLSIADPVASMKLDRLYRERHSYEDRSPIITRASKQTVDKVRELLAKRKQKYETISAGQ